MPCSLTLDPILKISCQITQCTQYIKPPGSRENLYSLLVPQARVAVMPKRILIADDSELIRRQIRMTLELDRDIEICAEAENGLDAVRKAQEYRPDLAVIDVFMPEMTGLAAVREIKKVMPTLPVLIFTLHDSHEIRIESKKAGADAVLPKADGGVHLSRTIHTLLRTHQGLP